jgi:hypothetical protein
MQKLLIPFKKIIASRDLDRLVILPTGGFYTDCVHGLRDGRIHLTGQSETIEPRLLRMAVSSYFGYLLPDGVPLFIAPCHPMAVFQNNRGLEGLGVYILGSWSGDTFVKTGKTRATISDNV